jgi:hypothetical protein
MNYAYKIPGAQSDPNTFVADNTLRLGAVDQPLDARTLVTVDYSQLITMSPLTAFSFRVKPGGEPLLWIDAPVINTAETGLSFFLSGGIAGGQYEITILVTMSDGDIRSDVLNVNVLGDGCGCAVTSSYPAYSDVVSSDGSIYVNTGPRFFVSATPPVAPNVLDRWYNVTDGVVSDYITNGFATSWIAAGAGGGGGGSVGAIIPLNPIAPDGVSTQFTLTAADGTTTVNIPGDAYLFVSVDGVWQQPSTEYLASGNTIEFNQAPTPDAAIFMLWLVPYVPASSGGL